MMTYFTAAELAAINAVDWQGEGSASRETVNALLSQPAASEGGAPTGADADTAFDWQAEGCAARKTAWAIFGGLPEAGLC